MSGRQSHQDSVSGLLPHLRQHRVYPQLQRQLQRFGQEPLNLGIAYRRLVVAQLLDLLGDDVEGVHLIVLGQEHGQ